MQQSLTELVRGRAILTLLALATLAFHVYYAVVGLPHPLFFRPAHLLFFVALPLLLKRSATPVMRVVDLVLAGPGVAAVAYILVSFERLSVRYVRP